MSASTKTWQNNQAPTVEDDDLNGFKEENNNLIAGSGQLLDVGDRQQTHKAVAVYASGGDFYTDGGSAAAFILTPIGSKIAPPSYFVGMRIAFEAANDNAASATVSVSGLGAVDLLTESGGNIPADFFSAGNVVEARYNGTGFVVEGAVSLSRITSSASGLTDLRNKLVAEVFGEGYAVALASITAVNGNIVGVVVKDTVGGVYTDDEENVVTASGGVSSLNELVWIAFRYSPYFTGVSTSVPISGGALNGGMFVSDRRLYLCEYDNHQIGVYDLSDPGNPIKINDFSTKFLPRCVEVHDGYLFVACVGNFAVEVYDIQIPESPVLIGEFATREQPKWFQIDGSHIFVASFTDDYVEKFQFALPNMEQSVLEVEKVGEVGLTAVNAFNCAYNGAGLLAVTGGSDKLALINTDTMAVISTTDIGTGNMPSSEWVTTTQLLVSNSGAGKLISVDCQNPVTPVITGDADGETLGEQITVVGDYAYIPTLTADGVPASVEIYDVSNAREPFNIGSKPVTVTGAGFTGVYQDADTAHLYVNGHFAPFNIDVLPIGKGNESVYRQKRRVHKSSAFSELSAGNLFSKTLQLPFKTETGAYTTTAEDTVIRAAGNTVTLGNPNIYRAGQLLCIMCVADTRVTVANSFPGLDTLVLNANESVLLQATGVEGARPNAWDVVATTQYNHWVEYEDSGAQTIDGETKRIVYASADQALPVASTVLNKYITIYATAAINVTNAGPGYSGALALDDSVTLHARADGWKVIN